MYIHSYRNGQQTLVGRDNLLLGQRFTSQDKWEIFANPRYKMSYGRMRMSGNIYEPVPETVTGDPSVGLSPIMDIDKFDPGTPWWEIYRNDLVIKRIEEAPPEVIEQQKKTIQ